MSLWPYESDPAGLELDRAEEELAERLADRDRFEEMGPASRSGMPLGSSRTVSPRSCSPMSGSR